MKKKVALFDMDGSLFDYDASMTDMLNKLRSPGEPEYKDISFHEQEKYPYLKARMELIKSVPGWWLNLKPIENGFAIYKLAEELGYDCQILTKGPRQHPLSWAEKLQCCQNHLGPDINVHITQNKGLFNGRFLYDDFIPYMKKFLEGNPNAFGIMPVNQYNKDWYDPRVVKWDGNNVEEIRANMLEGLKW